LISINERANLLRFDKNYIIIFKGILTSDINARSLYDEFINLEGSEKALNKLINYLLSRYYESFVPDFCPSSTEKDEYLADVIQFLGAVEA